MPADDLPPADHESFVRALSLHERVIRAYIRGAGIWRPEDVDEIIQEVSLIAWKKFDQLDKVEEFPRWACVIARYQVLEFRRQRARDRLILNDRVFELLGEEGLEETTHNELLLRCLEHCLEKLPANGRELVQSVYEHGIAVDELAQKAGQQANALYQKLWRIRQALRKCVEQAQADRSNPDGHGANPATQA